ncbi:MAG TPA: xanthine dehydrogenase [Rhodospirillaceae bacterium]|nr:xanthine dehydrogenase [Rhodospirillaceae bacterium]MAX61456.1 xanthine dehydrogenase [Rhodospirillaceae bacterium]MBB59085.1 xanthine dehydrogenase [Rhodospirillaceae bacterium]HAE02025.1 xanthine dehydrogenase [Rhodospirillaceae bacterium]|tara:strand:+ start:1368 stop:2060 length:693 start_codon:yes stop_codon:yes gene_type:complete
MKRSVLEQLQAARDAVLPTVLITDLANGAQALIVKGEVVAGDLVPDTALKAAADDCLRLDKSRTVDGYFLQIFNPPLRLIVVGAVHIAQALVPMATLAGYAVTVIDPRGAWASEARFPGVNVIQDWPEEVMIAQKPDRRTAIVALTHDPKLDDPALAVALKSDAFYIGALGSKKTAVARAERLKQGGSDPEAIAAIDGPIGLNIGAVSPAEIAVSILAKMTLALRGPKGG